MEIETIQTLLRLNRRIIRLQKIMLGLITINLVIQVYLLLVRLNAL